MLLRRVYVVEIIFCLLIELPHIFFMPFFVDVPQDTEAVQQIFSDCYKYLAHTPLSELNQFFKGKKL